MTEQEQINIHKEELLEAYSRSHDLSTASLRINISKEELNEIKKDPDFMLRIDLLDAELHEDIFQALYSNLASGDPRIRRQAAIDLGDRFWPDKFKPKDDQDKNAGLIPDIIMLKGAEKKNNFPEPLDILEKENDDIKKETKK